MGCFMYLWFGLRLFLIKFCNVNYRFSENSEQNLKRKSKAFWKTLFGLKGIFENESFFKEVRMAVPTALKSLHDEIPNFFYQA